MVIKIGRPLTGVCGRAGFGLGLAIEQLCGSRRASRSVTVIFPATIVVAIVSTTGGLRVVLRCFPVRMNT